MLPCKLFAQISQGRDGNAAIAFLPPPLTSREVSGVVKDESGQAVIGALVTLKSKADTLRTSTNEDGIFIFKNVKLAIFNVSVESIGLIGFVKKYLNSDITKKIVLDPITLKTQNNVLGEVKINGTPSIVYKTDTVEYRASDYHVRDNATLDELLKKMEGMEVGSDGSLTHQGQQVTRAKLNGKEFDGGNIAQAIQNLPADIIEKVQIVDDYGDQAARTGIKDGDPQKVLNVTTKADKSVGITGRIITQAGNDDRYNAKLSVQRINANETLSVIGSLSNTVNGVPSPGIQGSAGARSDGGPGTTQRGSPTLSYRDQWSKNVQVVSSYAYSFNNNNANNNSYGQTYTTFGPSNFINQNTTQNNSKSHTARVQLEIDLDSANFLQLNPSFSYSNSTTVSNGMQDNIRDYTTGFEHVLSTGLITNLNTSTNYGLSALYLHTFKKSKRNVSLQVSVNQSTSQANGGTNQDYKYYSDSTHNILLKDSAANLLTSQRNVNTTLQGTLTYTEPLGILSQLEFRGDIRHSINDVKAIQDTVLSDGQLKEITALDNIYHYSTTQSHISLNYRFNGTKANLTLGAAAIPYNLTGNKIDQNTSLNIPTSRSTFKIIPAFRFAYSWSRTERFQLTYSGQYNEPAFQYLQPFTDRSDPNNIKIGNPDLNPSFNNAINASYNNYIANSKFNIILNLTTTIIDNQITTNIVQVQEPLPPDPSNPSVPKYRNINNIYYINLDGTKSWAGSYNFSKQLDDRRYNISLNGNVTYIFSPAMSNNILYHQTEWRFDERFGPRVNPNDNIEINPYVSYDLDRSFTNALNSVSTIYKTTSLAVDGKIYFLKTYQINYSVAKSIISTSGINNIAGSVGQNTRPLVINLGFQKEFLPRKNLVFTFDVYDILHQNTILLQTVTPQGVTNTLSNSLSRYFLIGLRLNLQKWNGRPTRNGKEMKRRGDGSFIY